MSVTMHGRSTGTHTVELEHESGTVIRTMAPKDNGGDGSSFSPTDLFAVSIGACGCTIMNQFAVNKGLPVTGIEFSLVKEMSPPPRKVAKVSVTFRIKGELTDVDFGKLVQAGKTCPVLRTVGDALEIVDIYERA